MESCGMSCIKYLLFIFNLIFAISGIGIIVAGALVLSEIGEHSHFVENSVLAPPIVLIVAGAIVFIVAFLGCFGAIRESYSMLIAFSVCLLIIFIIELAVGIAAAVNKDGFQDGLKDSLKKSMKDYKINDAEKIAWDNVQTKLMCCGVDSPQDWQGLVDTVPYSCCHADRDGVELPNPHCVAANRGTMYFSNTGCLEKLQTKTASGIKVITGVGIGIAFIEIVGIILACLLASSIKKEVGK